MRNGWSCLARAISLGLRSSIPKTQLRSRRAQAWSKAGLRSQEMWESMAEQVSDLRVTAVDVKAFGPSAAREIGTYSLKTMGPPPQEGTGKYVVVWEKVGSDWKLATDIWNDGK